MSLSKADIAFAHDLFAGLGGITSRKMMGGLAIYCDGRIFSILSSQGTLYLKAKGAFAEELEAEGAKIFSMGDGWSMGYWTLPDTAIDDPEEACRWAAEALAAAE